MVRALCLSYNCGSRLRLLCSSSKLEQAIRRHYVPEPEIKPPGKVKSRITSAYMQYLDRFEDKFKTSLPRAHRLFRLFKDGVGEFFNDAKEYYSISSSIWSGAPLSNFTCNQLQLYRQMPSDLVRSAPIIISLPIPFATYLIFPIAYYLYPQYLLCQHFWTEEQKKIFGIKDYEQRLIHYKKAFNYLEGHLFHISDSETRSKFGDLLHKVKQGKEEVEPEEVLEFKEIFTTLPFGMQHLSERHKIHMWHLCKGLDVSTRASRMVQDLHLFNGIDSALHRDGFQNVKLSTIYQIGLLRGINPYEVSEDVLKKYLQKWVKVSTSLDDSSYSLLLHCPVLLSPHWFSRTP